VRLFYLIGLLVISTVVKAELNIDITQGIVGEIPIAITDFTNVPPNELAHLSAVIKNDLAISGRFKVIDPKKEKGAENIVVGRVQSNGPNRYTVSFELIDAFNVGATQKLVQKSYDNIRPQEGRALAHRISDAIYQALTGTRGAFSTRIAYVLVNQAATVYPYSLEVADSDGYNPKILMVSKEPIMSPTWSPDGKRLAFVSFENKQSEIYSIEVASGQRTLLSQFPGINGAPSWSPDGRSLALVLSKEGSPKIYLLDLATKQLKQITRGTNIDTEPVFEPNGQSLLFTSNRGGAPQIYRMNLKDNSVERLTFEGSYNARPRLTQDGKKMVMIHQGATGRFHIASQNLETGEVAILTHSELANSPSLAPNGSMILYGTKDAQKERSVLAMVTMDGRGRLRLPARQGNVQEPAWSPYLSCSGIKNNL
jgi:TolB protein